MGPPTRRVRRLRDRRRSAIPVRAALDGVGEPSRQANFLPLPPNRATGPRIYSRILDKAYGALKGVRRRNLVIGGNTYTAGDVKPLHYIRAMRLPSGHPPRMDLYGHNPFTSRPPALWRPYVGSGYADFSDLDTLAAWVDRCSVAGAGVPSSSSSPSSPSPYGSLQRSIQFLCIPPYTGQVASRCDEN